MTISQSYPACLCGNFGAQPSASSGAGEGWCQRRELNPRPKAYESSALPLSYAGKTMMKPNFRLLLSNEYYAFIGTLGKRFCSGMDSKAVSVADNRAPSQRRDFKIAQPSPNLL
jgi:hypothetical protein